MHDKYTRRVVVESRKLDCVCAWLFLRCVYSSSARACTTDCCVTTLPSPRVSTNVVASAPRMYLKLCYLTIRKEKQTQTTCSSPLPLSLPLPLAHLLTHSTLFPRTPLLPHSTLYRRKRIHTRLLRTGDLVNRLASDVLLVQGSVTTSAAQVCNQRTVGDTHPRACRFPLVAGDATGWLRVLLLLLSLLYLAVRPPSTVSSPASKVIHTMARLFC